MRHDPMLVLALLTGCVRSSTTLPAMEPPPVMVTMDVIQADSIASELVRRLFASESTGDEPDSLFDPESIVIAQGDLRQAVPRLAGVNARGQLQLVTSRVATTGAFVWGVMEYRWLPSRAGERMVVGYATVVMARRRDGTWRMVHLHSSIVAGEPD